MKYTFSYYRPEDYGELLEMALRSYQWSNPFYLGLSRLEFSKGLVPFHTGHLRAWEKTVAVYRENGKIAACVWNEGSYSGEQLFLFDSRERAEDRDLLREMLRFAKTFGGDVQREGKLRCADLTVPSWHDALKELAVEEHFLPTGKYDGTRFLKFDRKEYEVRLPEGYTFADGHTTPDFYLSTVHRAAFGYSGDSQSGEHGEQSFHGVRAMRYYRKDFDVCVLDPLGRPVAMGILWYDERMPYCELEPLGVVWWERRKGLATALLHELSNRILRVYPQCGGMTGGDQPFYGAIGYEEKWKAELYHWELEVPISWEKESARRRFYEEL